MALLSGFVRRRSAGLSDFSISSGSRFNFLVVREQSLPLPPRPHLPNQQRKFKPGYAVGPWEIIAAISPRALNSGVGIIFRQIIAPWDEF